MHVYLLQQLPYNNDKAAAGGDQIQILNLLQFT